MTFLLFVIACTLLWIGNILNQLNSNIVHMYRDEKKR